MSDESQEQSKLDLDKVFSKGYIEKYETKKTVERGGSQKKVKAQLDFIRQEAGANTVAEDLKQNEFAKKAAKTIRKMYGKYMSKESRRNFDGIEDRVIGIDSPAVAIASKEPIDVDTSNLENNIQGVAENLDNVDFVLLKRKDREDKEAREQLWSVVDQQKALEIWTDLNMNSHTEKEREEAVEKVKDVLQGIQNRTTTVHEELHVGENPKIDSYRLHDPSFSPTAFRETAVRYYTTKTLREMGKSSITNYGEVEQFYQELVDVYGEETMAMLYFGAMDFYVEDTEDGKKITKVDPLVEKILSNFTIEFMVRFFPEFSDAYQLLSRHNE